MKLLCALSLIAAALWYPTHAADRNSTDELIGFDKRRNHRAAVPALQQLNGREAVAKRVRGAKVDFDPALGSPIWVYSLADRLTGPQGRGKGVPEQIVERYRGE